MGNQCQNKSKFSNTLPTRDHKNSYHTDDNTKRIMFTKQDVNILSKKIIHLNTRESMAVQANSDDQDAHKNWRKKKQRNKDIQTNQFSHDKAKIQDFRKFHISTLTQNTKFHQHGQLQNTYQHICEEFIKQINHEFDKNKSFKIPTNPVTHEQIQIQQHIMNKKSPIGQTYCPSAQKVTKPCSNILSPELSINQITYRYSNSSKAQSDSLDLNSKNEEMKKQLDRLQLYKRSHDQIIQLMRSLQMYKYEGDFVGEVLSICNRHFDRNYRSVHHHHDHDQHINCGDQQNRQCISKYHISLRKLSGDKQIDLQKQSKQDDVGLAITLFEQFACLLVLFVERVNKKACVEIQNIQAKQRQKWQAAIAEKNKLLKEYQNIALDLYIDLELQKSLLKSYRASANKIKEELKFKIKELQAEIQMKLSETNMDQIQKKIKLNAYYFVQNSQMKSEQEEKTIKATQKIQQFLMNPHQTNQMNQRLLDKHTKLSLQ